MKWGKAVAVVLALGALLLLALLGAVLHRGQQIRSDMALVEAAERGDTARLTALLDRGVSANAAGFDGTSALWAAALFRRLPSVRLLLRHGANPDVPGQFGDTPLEAAVQNLENDGGTASAAVDVSIIRLLIRKGADTIKVKRDSGAVALLKSRGVKL